MKSKNNTQTGQLEKYFALTLDLEPEFSGILSDEISIYKKSRSIKNFLDILQKEGVKLSVFIVGELIEKFPEIISLFTRYDCEFHCHSFSHSRYFPDSEAEIRKCKEIFHNFFNKDPLGYRAPQGKISANGIKFLAKYGFKFDSSIFPSYYPNPFKYLFKNRQVHRIKNSPIIEIPITSISPFRLTLSLSYIKLLGFKLYDTLLKIFSIPAIIVFNTHLHDFLDVDESKKKLPLFWKIIYHRNNNLSINYLKKIIKMFKQYNYQFVYISEVYEQYSQILSKRREEL